MGYALLTIWIVLVIFYHDLLYRGLVRFAGDILGALPPIIPFCEGFKDVWLVILRLRDVSVIDGNADDSNDAGIIVGGLLAFCLLVALIYCTVYYVTYR